MMEIQDGSAKFIVRDKRIQTMVDMFYPIGSVYISADKSKTKADFPFMQYGTWEEVPANLCLQTGAVSEAGAQRKAGLPNIVGWSGAIMWIDHATTHGAYTHYRPSANRHLNVPIANDSGWDYFYQQFHASDYNSIYGSSDTVQPPAYMVRAWVRTA